VLRNERSLGALMLGASHRRPPDMAHWNGGPSHPSGSWGRFSFRGGAIDDDTISENGSSWFWANRLDRSAGKMCLPVHQRTDAVRLFEPRRYGSGKLPNVGVSDDGPYRSSDPTSSTSTAWDVGVFAAARAPRLSLRSKGRQVSGRFDCKRMEA
jgi:hypothetical protein